MTENTAPSHSPSSRVRILHISDLHFGGHADHRLWNQLVETVKGLRAEREIDLVIISGDLAENPSMRAMRKAASEVKNLRAALADNTPCFIIPGNHDQQWRGNIPLGFFGRIPYEIYFKNDGLQWSWGKRWKEVARLGLCALWPGKPELREEFTHRVYEGLGIVVFGINSTPPFWVSATGKVAEESIFKLADHLRQNVDAYKQFVKLAVVHHHPLPLAYTGTTFIENLQESLLIFYNAGTFLREAGQGGVDLVLHGHKHFAAFTTVSFENQEKERVQVAVLAAGSATVPGRTDKRGNHFNLITVFDDETILGEQWFYDIGIRRKVESRTHQVRGLDDVRSRRVRLAIRDRRLKVREVHKRVTIKDPLYTENEVWLKDCTVQDEGGLARYIFRLDASRPAYIRDFRVLSSPMQANPVLEKRRLRLLSGHIPFGRTWRPINGPFDLRYSYKLVNGHARTATEIVRKYAGTLEREYATVLCEEPTDLLRLTVAFPSSMSVSDFQFFGVADFAPYGVDNDSRHSDETARISNNISLITEENSAELEVPNPIVGYYYRLTWRYPQMDSPPPDRITEATVLAWRARLLRMAEKTLAGEPAEYERIEKLAKELARQIQKELPAIGQDEEIEIGLAVPDDRQGRIELRFVLTTTCPLAELFAETFLPGEGCAGYSFETGLGFLYDHGTPRAVDYYITRDEWEQDRKGNTDQAPEGAGTAVGEFEVLATIPWTKDWMKGQPVGVFCIGSRSKSSRLLHLFPKEGSDNQYFERILGLIRLFAGAIISIAVKEV